MVAAHASPGKLPRQLLHRLDDLQLGSRAGHGVHVEQGEKGDVAAGLEGAPNVAQC